MLFKLAQIIKARHFDSEHERATVPERISSVSPDGMLFFAQLQHPDCMQTR